MADRNTTLGTSTDSTVVSITFDDGSVTPIGARAFSEYLARQGGKLLGHALEAAPIGGGLVRVTVRLDAIDCGGPFTFDASSTVPIAIGGGVTESGLRANVTYYMLIPEGESDPVGAELWADTADALQTNAPDRWITDPVGLTLADGTPATASNHTLVETLEDGTEREHTLAEFGLDPQDLVCFWTNEEKRYLTFGDLAGGVLALQAVFGVASQIRAKLEAPLTIRAGKHFTQAMKATSKRGTYEHESGGAFIMAGDLMIAADKAEALTLSVGEKKLLAYLNHLATTSGYGYEAGRNCTVSTTIDAILEARGLEPTRKNREAARRDVRKLARQAWEFKNTKTHEWVRIPLAGGAVQIRRGGAVEFSISAAYMHAILNTRASLLPVDPALLRTDDRRNPHAYLIGYKLTTQTYLNHGEANESTLSVRKLLDYVETLPTPDEIKGSGRNYTQKIIQPMERDLDALVERGVLSWWDYCHAKGEPLTDEEQAQRLDADGNERPLPYEIAKKVNIQWELAHEYAEHMAGVMESRERRRKMAQAARQEEAETARRIQRKKEGRIARALADRELGANWEKMHPQSSKTPR